MSSPTLPTRLRKEPLIEAVFEIRAKASAPLATLLPGLLRSGLEGGVSLVPERTSASAIPDNMRAQNPQLKHAPLVSMPWGNFRILLGDANVVVGCQLPYPGWATFREAIYRILEVLVASKLVDKLERYSIKYVDIIQKLSLQEQISALDWSLKIGQVQIASEVTMLRTEIKNEDFLSIVTVQTGASATFHGTDEIAKGVLVDVDTIYRCDGLKLEEFMINVEARVNALHGENKRMFFNCLTKDTIDSLEPEYAT